MKIQKQSDKIREEIIELLKNNPGKEIRQKQLIQFLKNKGFTIGAIRGVLYQHENNLSQQINGIHSHRVSGSMYYEYYKNELHFLEKEILKFIKSLSDNGLLSIETDQMTKQEISRYYDLVDAILNLRNTYLRRSNTNG